MLTDVRLPTNNDRSLVMMQVAELLTMIRIKSDDGVTSQSLVCHGENGMSLMMMLPPAGTSLTR